MQTLILRSDSEEKIDKIIKTAKDLGISISKISKENIEDFGIALVRQEQSKSSIERCNFCLN